GYLDISVPKSYGDYVGTDDKITIDGVDWYAIERTTYNGKNMVKIFMADTNVINGEVFNSTLGENAWTDSPIRNTILPNWLSDMPTLKSMVVFDHPDAGKATYSPALSPNTNGDSYVDSIFLISESEYDTLLRSEQKKSSYIWWLRTPGTYYGRVMYGYTTGTLETYGGHTTGSIGVRPALWIYH
ncbi:MAG: DUF6273 domain-containing protein, partial [Rikenellaceae bacterium]